MPRPETITAADLARWDGWIDQSDDPDIRHAQTIPRMREVCRCGYWLEEQLQAMGWDTDRIQRACFALGQQCFFAADVWDVAVKSLADCRAGRPDEPGPELAERLCRENGL